MSPDSKRYAHSALFGLIFALALVLSSPLIGLAEVNGGDTSQGGVSGGDSPKTFTLQNPLKVDSIGGLIENLVVIFSYLVILFAVIMLIWVGLQFILARGNSVRMNELKNYLLYIVIGVAVVIGARVMIRIIINTLSASGTVNPAVIQSAQDAINNNK